MTRRAVIGDRLRAFGPSRGLSMSAIHGSTFDPLTLTPALFLSPAGPFYSDLGTTLVTTDGSAVRRWGDASGNARHADAPNDSARPTLRVSGGFTWLEFDGIDDRLDVAAFAGHSIASAYQHTSGANFNTLWGDRDPSDETAIRLFSATKWGHDGAFDLIPAGAWYVNGVNTQVTANDANERVIGSFAAPSTPSVGWSVAWTTSGTTRYWVGRVYALLIGSAAWTADDRTNLDGWLQGRMP